MKINVASADVLYYGKERRPRKRPRINRTVIYKQEKTEKKNILTTGVIS